MSIARRALSAVDVLTGLTVRRTAGKVESIRRRVNGEEWVAPV